MACFDDVVCYYFVEDADGFREGIVVVAEGEEEGFYCFLYGQNLGGVIFFGGREGRRQGREGKGKTYSLVLGIAGLFGVGAYAVPSCLRRKSERAKANDDDDGSGSGGVG